MDGSAATEVSLIHKFALMSQPKSIAAPRLRNLLCRNPRLAEPSATRIRGFGAAKRR
jgi:hypothetical protein